MESDSNSKTSCICDIPQMKTLTCFNKACLATWTIEREFYERNHCPMHKYIGHIQICSFPLPELCSSCRNNGYYIEKDPNDGRMFPKLELKKRDVDSN